MSKSDLDPVAVLREHYEALEACRPGNLPGGLSGPPRDRRERYERSCEAVPAALAELERRQKVEARLTKWLEADDLHEVSAQRIAGEWCVVLSYTDADNESYGYHERRDADYWTALNAALDAAGAEP